MTLAEVKRAVESKRRIEQNRARFDYTHALLVGRSVARIFNSNNTIPTLAEAYPYLFNLKEEEQAIQAATDELSVIRFKQFAKYHNDNFKGGGIEK